MESKFSKALAGLRTVPTNQKASNDTAPTITCLGIPNKLQINRLAAAEMGLKLGDRVRIFDFKDAESMNERFFIAKTTADDPNSAKVGKANSGTSSEVGIDLAFNYAAVWSVLVQGDPKAVELGYDAMVEKGCCVKGETVTGRPKYRSTKVVKVGIEVASDEPAEIEGRVYEKVFAFVNYSSTNRSAEDIAKDMEKAAAKEEDSNDASDVDFEEEGDETEE
jgi:hypothetical protein